MTMHAPVDVVLPGMKVRVAELDNAVLHFDVSSQSRRISARWRRGELRVIVPPGSRVTDVVNKLLEMKLRIMSSRPEVLFSEGQHMEFTGFTVDIKRQSFKPSVVTLTGDTFAPVVSVGSDLDFSDPMVSQLVSKLMCVVAKTVAPQLLLPRAREIASRLGLEPAGWRISTGHRTLGTCSSRKVISLSAVVVFLPARLRDYIICHELAHLTEMNHSPRFHELCDSYCDGQERELIKELKKFKWPILRQ